MLFHFSATGMTILSIYFLTDIQGGPKVETTPFQPLKPNTDYLVHDKRLALARSRETANQNGVIDQFVDLISSIDRVVT